MRSRLGQSEKEHKQYVLIARWLDYLSSRFTPPGRLKRSSSAAFADNELEPAPIEFFPLVKETLFEKWFWVGVAVVLNLILAGANLIW